MHRVALATLALSAIAGLAGCGGAGTTDPTTVSFAQAASSVQAADKTHAYFTQPAYGAMATGQSVAFAWTAVTGAIGYELEVGTPPGGSDLYESGLTTKLSATVGGLLGSQLLTLYTTPVVYLWLDRLRLRRKRGGTAPGSR